MKRGTRFAVLGLVAAMVAVGCMNPVGGSMPAGSTSGHVQVSVSLEAGAGMGALGDTVGTDPAVVRVDVLVIGDDYEEYFGLAYDESNARWRGTISLDPGDYDFHAFAQDSDDNFLYYGEALEVHILASPNTVTISTGPIADFATVMSIANIDDQSGFDGIQIVVFPQDYDLLAQVAEQGIGVNDDLLAYGDAHRLDPEMTIPLFSFDQDLPFTGEFSVGYRAYFGYEQENSDSLFLVGAIVGEEFTPFVVDFVGSGLPQAVNVALPVDADTFDLFSLLQITSVTVSNIPEAYVYSNWHVRVVAVPEGQVLSTENAVAFGQEFIEESTVSNIWMLDVQDHDPWNAGAFPYDLYVFVVRYVFDPVLEDFVQERYIAVDTETSQPFSVGFTGTGQSNLVTIDLSDVAVNFVLID